MLVLFFAILFVHTICSARPLTNDTIPNWQIFHDDKLVLRGTGKQIEKLVDTVHYKLGIKYLVISYNDDAPNLAKKEIEIWDGKNLLTRETFKENPLKVDLWTILSTKTKGRIVTVDIFYTDDSKKMKTHLGQLIIFFPYRATYR
jgi:hypothetical protein